MIVLAELRNKWKHKRLRALVILVRVHHGLIFSCSPPSEAYLTPSEVPEIIVQESYTPCLMEQCVYVSSENWATTAEQF